MSWPHLLEPAGLPTESYTQPFWLTQPSELASHRTTDTLPDTVDVVVIGSGLSASTLCYKLLKANPSLRVVVLEAREICSGASGRNGGQVKTDVGSTRTWQPGPLADRFYLAIHWILKAKYGAEMGNELLQFETGHLARFEALLASDPIPCSFHVTTAYDVCLTEDMAKKARDAFRERATDWPEAMRPLRELDDPEELQRLCGIKDGYWGCMYRVASIWPYKLATGLLARCFQLAHDGGVDFNVQTRTPVTNINHSDETWTVDTERGSIQASKVVVCTNGYTSNLLPEMSNKIVPVRGTASALRPPSPQSPSTPSNKVFRPLFTSYAPKFGAGKGDYMISRQEDDKFIILGGAKQGYIEEPRNWYGNVDDNELLPGAVDYFTSYMPKHFVNWPDETSNVEKVWTGIMGYSSDFLPWVGQHPDRPDGLYLMAGFHGHGMSRILGCAEALAALILSNAFEQSTATNVLLTAGLPEPYIFTKERLDSSRNDILESMGQGQHLISNE